MKNNPTQLTHRYGFTFLEVVVSATIFFFIFSALGLSYWQSQRIFASVRQNSTAEDLALSNIEFLKTRSWIELTRMVDDSPSQPHSSINLIEPVSTLSTPSPIYSHLELVPEDPLHLGLKNARRDLSFSPKPEIESLPGQSIKGTVLITWDSGQGTRMTNTVTSVFTKPESENLSPNVSGLLPHSWR